MPDFLAALKADYPGALKGGLGFSYSPQADRQLVDQGIEMMASQPPEILIGDFTACDNFDVIPRLGDIKLPAMALVGADDNMTPVKYSQFLVDKIPDCRLKVIEGAGHMLTVEQPEAATEAIAEFMATIKPV